MPSEVRVKLRKNATGEVRELPWQTFDDGFIESLMGTLAQHCWFCWHMGNWSCDCNREFTFQDIYNPDVECSRGRYTLLALYIDGQEIEDCSDAAYAESLDTA